MKKLLELVIELAKVAKGMISLIISGPHEAQSQQSYTKRKPKMDCRNLEESCRSLMQACLGGLSYPDALHIPLHRKFSRKSL